MNKPDTIDEYIRAYPQDIRDLLQKLRRTIADAAPGAQEVISYGMPAFRLRKILVYFAAHKNRIGFYPTASGIQKFSEELSAFKFSKGAVQFPYEKPIPFDLVTRIVKFRATLSE